MTHYIKDLFEKDPKRPIERVVSVEQHDPDVVKTEIEEYVVTDEIRSHFSNIVDRFVETSITAPESVCGWISGFFGSGKSHFLKVLGYVLSNKPLTVGTQTMGASSFFCDKYNIPGGYVLGNKLKTQSIFINVVIYDSEKGPSISHIIYRAVLRQLDLSEVEWISEIEKGLKLDGLWGKLLEFVKTQEKKEWQELRNRDYKAISILSRALNSIDPERFPSIELAERSVQHVKENFHLDQTLLAQRLLEIAENSDPNDGRIVILLDEVGLYIGTNTDRLNDLNAVAEQISKFGKGKVWLFVTSQEVIEKVIPKFSEYNDQFQKIQDRFQINILLTPKNIDTVVKRRLLKKKKSSILDILDNSYSLNSGSLATGASLKNLARDSEKLYSDVNREQFRDSYPFMPYSISLMQAIFGLLRSKGGLSESLTGRERAVLQVVRSILAGTGKLADMEIGRLATFDMVYDAINEELKIGRSEEQASIEKDIAAYGSVGMVPVVSVAKALFLLQTVETWLPCTSENIAAVLYPELGSDSNEHLANVKKCLKIILNGKYITEEEGKFRFLSQTERTFEEEIGRQKVSDDEINECIFETEKSILSDMKKYNHLTTRNFDVHIYGDNTEITTKGHVCLEFFSPRITKDKSILEKIRNQSIARKDSAFWLSKVDELFEEKSERAVKLGKAIRDKKNTEMSSDEQVTMNNHIRELELLMHDHLPRMLCNSACYGTVIYQGEETYYNGTKNLQAIFSEQIKNIIEEIFTEFSHGNHRLQKEEDITKILAWQGGKLPNIYYEMQLVEESTSTILLDRPMASRVLAEIRRRSNEAQQYQTGISISDHFEKPPYGWDPKIIRMTLATLFKNGSISVNLDGKDYFSPYEVKSEDVFLDNRTFNKARFLPAQDVSRKERDEATDLIAEMFGEAAGNTTEDVNRELERIVKTKIDDCKRMETICKIKEVSLEQNITDLRKSMEKVLESTTVNRRILTFLDSTNKEVFRSNLPVLTKLIEFEKNSNFDQFDSIKNFLDLHSQTVIDILKDGNLQEDIKYTSGLISSKEFINEWYTISGSFQQIFGAYSTLYLHKHTERNHKVKSALSELYKHKTMSTGLKKEAELKINKMITLSCSVEQPLLDYKNQVCNSCRSTLKEIVAYLEVIEGRKDRLNTELNELIYDSKTDREDNLQGFEVLIASNDGVNTVVDRILETVNIALRNGKSVTLTLKINNE